MNVRKPEKEIKLKASKEKPKLTPVFESLVKEEKGGKLKHNKLKPDIKY